MHSPSLAEPQAELEARLGDVYGVDWRKLGTRSWSWPERYPDLSASTDRFPDHQERQAAQRR